MTDKYRIPKRLVRAQVVIAGEPPRDLYFFVGLRAPMRDEGERPSDLLNGSESFVPVRDGRGQTWLLNLEAVLVVTVAAAEESVARALEFQSRDASCANIAVSLTGGLRVRGSVRYVLPEGQQRLQNYLGQSHRFMTVHEGPWVHLIHRQHIVWVHCPAAEGTAANDEPLGAVARPRI